MCDRDIMKMHRRGTAFTRPLQGASVAAPAIWVRGRAAIGHNTQHDAQRPRHPVQQQCDDRRCKSRAGQRQARTASVMPNGRDIAYSSRAMTANAM